MKYNADYNIDDGVTGDNSATDGSESGGGYTDGGYSSGGYTDSRYTDDRNTGSRQSRGRNSGYSGNKGSGRRAGRGTDRDTGSHGLLILVAVIAGILLLAIVVPLILMNLNTYLNPTLEDPYPTDSNFTDISDEFTVIDRQNPSKSNSFDDNQTGVIYSNTLSLPYGSKHYILRMINLVPPVTISASNMVPENSQALLEFLLRDSNGNSVKNILHDSSDIMISEKMTIRTAGDYTLVIDGKFIESVDIFIEKKGFLNISANATRDAMNKSLPASESKARQE
ncbi:MAG: hypothetical protein J5703_07725 [Methanomicrobium sp.]|nr:hypothetical protein [Methanomicrobium sp.]